MLNRPRGISFNKNAVNTIQTLNTQNTQLHHSPNEPLPPKLSFNLTRNANLAQENLIQISDEPAKQQDELKKAVKLPLGQLKDLQQLVEPAPAARQEPKLQPLQSLSLNQTQLQPLQPQQQQPQLPKQSQQQLIQQQQLLLQQQNESLISRIPRLSLRFPVLPLASNKDSTTNTTTNKSNMNIGQKTHSGPLPSLAEDAMSVSSEDEEIEDIDKSTSRDAIFQVSEIAKDIYEYMNELEVQQAVREDYLKEQKILTPKVRQRLVNWCIDIHSQLRLLPETLYTTIMVIDRYFDQVTVKQQSQVQLVAVGATLIASKYEEIYPPDVGDLMHLTQNAYSRREIMRIEIQILEQLDFNLGKPIPLAFLRRFSKAAHCDVKMHSIAKYLMELSLNEYECAHWRPSLLAAASLYVTIHLVHPESGSGSGASITRSNSLAGNLTRKIGIGASQSNMQTSMPQDRWNKTLVHYTHYTKAMLQGPAGTLCKILRRSQKTPQSYTCAKKNLPNLSKWPELKTSRVDDLIKLGRQLL